MTRTNVMQLQRRLQDWVQQPATERNYQRGPRQMIDAALADPARSAQLAIAAYLHGTWHLASGQAAVLAGGQAGLQAGWDAVRVGASLQRAALLLRARRNRTRDLDPALLPTLQSANCIAVCLALDEPGAEDLYAAFLDRRDACFDAADAWPLFVRELLALRSGRRPVAMPGLHPYDVVLQAWAGDAELLARRLATLLDHHLDATHGSPGQRADFDEPGLLLYPAEVLAIRAVRHTLELSWPKVEHPLMFTNLATTQPSGPWPRDPLLQQLDRALRRD